MKFQTIISPLVLAENLNNPDWLILDCRGDPLSEQHNYEEYCESHIPNAYYCSLSDHFENDEIIYTCPSLDKPEKMISHLIKNGFKQDSQIVLYDNGINSFTDNMWLLLRSMGCNNVAVLQGGFPAWLAYQLPLSNKISNDINLHASSQIH